MKHTDRDIDLTQVAARAMWYMMQPGGFHNGPLDPQQAYEHLRADTNLGRYSDNQLRRAVGKALRDMELTQTFHRNTSGHYGKPKPGPDGAV